MATCPRCSAGVESRQRFCGACGAFLESSSETRTMPIFGGAAARLRTTPGPAEGRFPIGAVLAQRYQLVGLAGKGGMGEVYKVSDLVLRQTVALKFLTERLAATEDSLERFRKEVRLARQVSHPNVCRVYDIGEVGGFPFLSAFGIAMLRATTSSAGVSRKPDRCRS